MAREIAVFLGDGGLSAELGERGKVTVFRRWQGAWEVVRETECFLDAGEGLRELRRKLAELLQFMGDCRIFVAQAVSGVVYYELEKAGFNIWEYSGEPSSYLEQIWALEEEHALNPTEQAPLVVVAPQKITEGHFTVSLKEIQEKNAGITSKQVLMPFVRKGDFRLLEIFCNHLPPWLEAELSTGHFAYETEKRGKNELIVKITNTQHITN